MKKSTLFFKVMVLLALLVPWTSWGQSQLPGGIDENDVIAQETMVLGENGDIPDDNSGGGKNVNLSEFNFKPGYTSDDWDFVKPASVLPDDSGVEVRISGNLKLDGRPKEGVDAIYIKIKNNNGDEKWARYGFIEDGTIVIENLQIAYSEENGSRVYNGKALIAEEVKEGLTITAKNKNGEPIEIGDDAYTISVPENSIDKDIYTITVNITGEYAGVMTATTTFEITARPVTVTLEGLELKKGANGTNLKASDYASYFKFEEENTQDKSGLVRGEKAKVTGTFDIDTQTVGDASFSTDDLDVVPDNSSFASENYTIKWYGKATITKKDFSEGGEGGQGGTIIVTVVDKTYNGKPVDSPEVKDSETTLEKDKDYTVTYKDENEKDLEKAPSNAGTYTVVITPTESGDYEGSPIEKNFTISKAKVTVAGTLTITEGDKLKDSYKFDDIKDLKADGIVEGEEETVKAAITITPKNKENPTASDDAFTITLAETVINYTISEESKIALVVEEDPDKWQEGEAKAEVTVYVNEEGQLKYDEGYGSSVNITLDGISELAGWSFVLEENPEEDFDVLAVMSGDEVVMEGLSWATLITTDKVITGLQVSSENKNSIYESLTESKSVKVRLEKDGADGYLLITFKQGESTEEPGGDDEDMTWAENKKASITVYVDKSSGQPLKSEPAMDSKGFAIDLAKFEELEGEWSFATTDDNAIIDKDLSALYSFVVFEGDLLLEPQSEFNSESLSSVKVKIENGDNVGYLEINFKTITVIAEDDINKGGDDDNDDEQIDDDKITFVGEATGAKYVIYDGLPHGLGMLEITVDGETKVLKETDGAYDVVYGESEEEPVDAGTYSATITFNEAMGYSGTVILENSVKIEKRPLNISFSFSEPIEEGKVPTLDDAEISLGETSLGEGDYLTDCIDVTFRISNEQNADKKYDVYIEHISITNSTSENNGFNPSNYDITIVCKGGVSVKMEDTDGDGVLNDNDEDFNDDSVGDIAVDDIETVDPDTGEGSTGTFYKKYELYLANKDYLKNNEETREHYASEGLELFSRHNKKTTWAGGSFTIWYEHNGEMNEGGYRIFWSNRADGDYKEVKLDEVSGYYQIRNVNSNVYVKIYYETGFPVANEEITATDVRAYAQANKIVVITPEPTDVQIISMAGAVVATDQVTGQREFANLAEGVYIVRMGETVIKLQVRN